MRKLNLIALILTFVIVGYWTVSHSQRGIYAKENNLSTTNNITYNPVYKDRIYGNPFRGLAISIEPVKKQYEVGERIDISILFRNFGKEMARWSEISGEPIRNYRFSLVDPNGRPLPKSSYAEDLEISTIGKRPQDIFSIRGDGIGPGVDVDMVIITTLRLDPYFKIEKEGTYFLVIMRRVTESWEDGFLISNMTKINIVNKN
jgi:hypothetical protein